MNNSLLGKYDITTINFNKEDSSFNLSLNFQWEIDCGCFTYTKQSNLTILFPYKIIDLTILQQNPIIFNLILGHKEYTGKLIDLKEKRCLQ